MNLKWNDVSSYSRGETNRVPHTFEATIAPWGIRVVVTRHLHLAPTDWKIGFLGYEYVLKDDVSLEQAQEYAETKLADYAKSILHALGETFLGQP